MLRLRLPRSTRLLAPASAAALLLVTAPAFAQSVTPPSSTYHPVRIVGGQDAGTSTRNAALDPYGINYADCTSGTVLQFSLSAAGFSSGDLLQVWAAPATTDCGPDSSRLGTPPACHTVANQVEGLGSAPTNVTIDVSAVTLVNGSCTSQATSAAVPMNIWFVPTDSTGHVLNGATLYEYDLTTDLVGPSPPSLGQIGVGDTFLTVNWTPSSDSDTFGYDLFLDPPPGTTPPLAPTCVEGGTNSGGCLTASSIVCDTSVLGAASILPDAGTPDTGTTPEGGTLESGTAGEDAGGEDGSTATGSTDDAETGDAGSGLPGGIGTIPSKYLVSPSSPTGITIPTPTTGSYTLSNLESGAIYNVVVASVDGSGNVGPASTVQCNYPAPILDFYQTYGTDGGRASGCALDSNVLPGGAAASAAALLLGAGAMRRRNRRLRATPKAQS